MSDPMFNLTVGYLCLYIAWQKHRKGERIRWAMFWSISNFIAATAQCLGL